ncbi:MAG: tetratricopeptide repeat protein [Anaerolineales bacterium]|nr:tetratricopeptide repeat protein [Anaerolineales bacterium]
MAKVSLRSYNRETELLIEQGHLDEAIAHCRHILKVFPKHLETYRMLGKAYLEAHRYEEAADIFGRLLMAVPDDFVAHVGLSIINDEAGKLDDAIWHMERAFESQSSNSAIQSELQRLYGRRDGMEPPKVRMTRGALARIYTAGELYPQAIAEIRGVLAEDPQRADMQTLLAYCYFKNNQRADSTDVCNQLLKRYAYSFDANRILVELLPASAAAESTQVYRMHIAEMDPYSNFVKGSIFQTETVADAAVSLERLDYVEEEVQMGQDWNKSALGYPSAPSLESGASFVEEQPDWLRSEAPTLPATDSATEERPDWLLSETTDAPQTPPAAESQVPTVDDIPDFLREAGWGQASGPEQPTSFFDEEPSAGIIEADMPDWLKAQTPPADSLAPTLPPISHASEASNFLGDDGFDPFEGEAVSGDVPDWLKSASESEVAPSFETSAPQPVSEDINEADLPDWLKSENNPTDAATESSTDTPDWLKGFDETPSAESATDAVSPAAEAGDLPDWLAGAEPESETSPFGAETNAIAETPAAQPNVESLGASAQEQDDAVAWLESLAAKHGAKPEELVTDPNKRSETPPEWVAQAQSVGAEMPAAQPNVESLGASAQEQDDAVAWLESLAAKHGAKPEELVTDPNKRSETPPEWVAQAQSVGAETPAAQPNVESLGASAQEQDDAVAWLESLAAKHGAKPEELVTDPNKRSETPPEWVAQAQSVGAETPAKKDEPESAKTEWSENAANIGEEFFAEFEKDSSVSSAVDETGVWLSSLEGEQKAAETAEEETRLESGEIPEWLKEEETPPAPVRKTSLDTSSLSGWLDDLNSGADEETPTTEKTLIQNQDLSEWLGGLDDEPGLDVDIETLRAPQPPFDAKLEREEKAEELPDWLAGADEARSEKEEWTPPTPPAADAVSAAVVSAETSADAELPDWLQGMDEDEPIVETTPQPTLPSDWKPVAATQKAEEANPPSAQPGSEASKDAKPLSLEALSPEPVASVARKKPSVKSQPKPARPKKEAQGGTNLLALAKAELDRGDIPEALAHYGKLIKRGKFLEESIGHLSESLYRYPVEVGVWQALGDAYMRANRLKEALEAYNKAEELIR